MRNDERKQERLRTAIRASSLFVYFIIQHSTF